MQNTIQRYIKRTFFTSCLALTLFSSALYAQKPVIKIDLNFSGRNEAEVHELGYTSWPIPSGTVAQKTIDGIQFSLKGNFTSDWYKAGVQAPFYAKLVNDGITTKSPVELTITGLKEGSHTLLSFHNSFSQNTTAVPTQMAIYIDGKLAVDKLVPSTRAEHTTNAQLAYLTLQAKAGVPVVIRYQANDGANFSINGFELNTPNLAKQAKMPMPVDADEHVNLGNNITLKWTAAANVKSHDVYFGLDKNAVENANRTSPEFKGSQSDTIYPVKNLYSMQTYYWRIDEHDKSGNITKGKVWYFRPAQLAFKGAEGYGRFARGGRGGKVVHVTNLNDSGAGSLREAVNNDIGPRTIVFDVGGVIKLESRLVVNQPYVTIAGQTAPGKGITITAAPIGLTGNDGIIRFLRVRVGAGRTYDGMGLTGANHSIIDHCSISWTIDEAFSSRGAHHISLQNTLISEALNVADHGKYEKGKMHGYAATIGGDIGSFHHNLLAHNYGRNWSIGGGLNGNGAYGGKLDIRNNVVYNWGRRTTDGGANEVNFVNNYYKPGKATEVFYALKAQHEGVGSGMQRYYFAGNVMPGYFDEKNQEQGRAVQGKVDYETFVNQEFFPSYVTTQSAKDAYKRVLSDVGANQPVFDYHDLRIIKETQEGTFTYKGSKSGIAGMIDTQADVGGLEDYPTVKRESNWDSDGDGLPDWWETTHNLNPKSANGDFSDSNADVNKDGFTNLDDYLQWMAEPHYFLNADKTQEVDLAKLFMGYEAKPVYSIKSAVNGKVKIVNHIAQFVPDKSGFGNVVFTVKDQDGSTMTRTVNFYIAAK